MKHNWKKNEDGTIDEFAWESGFHNGVICVDCGKTVCVCCHPDYMEMGDCKGKPKSTPQTNADRIRAMSDEELAEILACPYQNDGLCFKAENCEKCIIDWLRQPEEEV